MRISCFGPALAAVCAGLCCVASVAAASGASRPKITIIEPAAGQTSTAEVTVGRLGVRSVKCRIWNRRLAVKRVAGSRSRGVGTYTYRVAGAGAALNCTAISRGKPRLSGTATASRKVSVRGLRIVSTNCGDGITYATKDGRMTARDFEALGESAPFDNSTSVTWIVPKCGALPQGQQPGGRSDGVRTIAHAATAGRARAGAATGIATPNWAGFQSNTSNSYSSAQSRWTLPAAVPSPPNATYESSWVGIGNGSSKSGAMFQAGTELDVTPSPAPVNPLPAYASMYAWWELYPDVGPYNGQQTSVPTDQSKRVSAGQKLQNFPIRLGGTYWTRITIPNRRTGQVSICSITSHKVTCVATIRVSFPKSYTVQQSTYECIAERTEINGILSPFSDIKGTWFKGCGAVVRGSGKWQWMGRHRRLYLWATRNRTVAKCGAPPYSVETGKIHYGAFPIRWLNYGYPQRAKACGV